MILHGVGASAGIGIGKAVCVRRRTLDYSGVQYAGAQAERARLAAAVQAFTDDTGAMAAAVRARTGPREAEILEGQITMLLDPFLQAQIGEEIEAGRCAEAALDAVCTGYAELFFAAQDERMRQRAADVQDMRRRMLGLLLGHPRQQLSALPAGTVLVAQELTPSMTVDISPENVAAILTGEGGRTSHSAILARALEIPAVLGAADACTQVHEGDLVVVDGDEGLALTEPDEKALAAYRKKQAGQQARRAALEAYRRGPTLDADKNRYALCANIGSAAGAAAAVKAGAEGVGLMRTEFLFMERAGLPTEEEQYEAYSQAACALEGRELIVRTLDVGGDKKIEYFSIEKEDNPFLGHRAIRWCLAHPEVFCVQLRALLRAGAQCGNIRIMLPLVTGVQEVRAARALIARCAAQLAADGVEHTAALPVGVMIETPAAAFTADLLAREADFFSIGTNDLTQYTLAVDRGNARVEALYTPFHPAVLRAVHAAIRAAKKAGIPVGMCGEAAADPRMTPLLLAFGLDEFSVSAPAVPAVRGQIAAWHIGQAQQAADAALKLPDAESVEAYLTSVCADR